MINLNKIIADLRKSCPGFEQKIGGALEFEKAKTLVDWSTPFAFVLPLSENGGEQRSSNGYLQEVTASFAVVIVVSNTSDSLGQDAYSTLEALINELDSALLARRLGELYDPISYVGGELLSMDGGRLFWQVEYQCSYEIHEQSTWQFHENEQLGELQSVHIQIDLANPDGQIEARNVISLNEEKK